MTRPKIIRHITDFAYRTTIGVEVFIVAGISLLLITNPDDKFSGHQSSSGKSHQKPEG
jgi:hypothetical protein